MDWIDDLNYHDTDILLLNIYEYYLNSYVMDKNKSKH